LVVANAAHEGLCREEMKDLEGARLLLEPHARNTAAAIVMAAAVVRDAYGPDALILVMPSDHLIGDSAGFHDAVATGTAAAEVGRLVTFGVLPTGPETGYGYLEAGQPLEDAEGAFLVERFTEKPNRDVAEAMVATGNHFWNGGIFLFTVDRFLSEAFRLAPEISACAEQAIEAAVHNGSCIHPSAAALGPCPSVSVDYAVMELSDRVAMVPLAAHWSDIGSWDALAQLPAPPSGQGLVNSVQSNNCYVRTDGVKVGLLGVDDLVVVASGDRVLIMRKGQSQHIRQLAAEADAI
jgi:mannose-1-phosphate guanylyltransferase/mannose-1-phosphate guanylyltransferase/mannose-6-phosphate isomerase